MLRLKATQSKGQKMDRLNNIDPFEQIEMDHDALVRGIRNGVAIMIVVAGSAWLVWFLSV